jgi:hypothetical protein
VNKILLVLCLFGGSFFCASPPAVINSKIQSDTVKVIEVANTLPSPQKETVKRFALDCSKAVSEIQAKYEIEHELAEKYRWWRNRFWFGIIALLIAAGAYIYLKRPF